MATKLSHTGLEQRSKKVVKALESKQEELKAFLKDLDDQGISNVLAFLKQQSEEKLNQISMSSGTVSELHSVLGRLIDAGRGDYKIEVNDGRGGQEEAHMVETDSKVPVVSIW